MAFSSAVMASEGVERVLESPANSLARERVENDRLVGNRVRLACGRHFRTGDVDFVMLLKGAFNLLCNLF